MFEVVVSSVPPVAPPPVVVSSFGVPPVMPATPVIGAPPPGRFCPLRLKNIWRGSKLELN